VIPADRLSPTRSVLRRTSGSVRTVRIPPRGGRRPRGPPDRSEGPTACDGGASHEEGRVFTTPLGPTSTRAAVHHRRGIAAPHKTPLAIADDQRGVPRFADVEMTVELPRGTRPLPNREKLVVAGNAYEHEHGAHRRFRASSPGARVVANPVLSCSKSEEGKATWRERPHHDPPRSGRAWTIR
jgi:hypothetical protein